MIAKPQIIGIMCLSLCLGQSSQQGAIGTSAKTFQTGFDLKHAGRPTKVTAEQYRLKIVQHLMSLPSPLQHATVLRTMGDEASADVLKVLATAGPLRPYQEQTVLDIVHVSFERPQAIVRSEDRQPTAARSLLQQIGSSTQEQATRDRVASEIEFVNSAASVVAQ